MMNSHLKLASLGIAVLIGTAIIWGQRNKRQTGPKTQNEANQLIAGYRQWTKVNPHPVEMSKTVAELCAAPLTHVRADSAKPQADNPHFRKFITVYVNQPGRIPMLEQKTPHFPVGSIIVKEKLPSEKSQAPELLTVMVKREAGYHPASGDWEYLVMDGKGEKITAQGKLESCHACHLSQKKQDFVYRTYAPAGVIQSQGKGIYQ